VHWPVKRFGPAVSAAPAIWTLLILRERERLTLARPHGVRVHQFGAGRWAHEGLKQHQRLGSSIAAVTLKLTSHAGASGWCHRYRESALG
jgi:hypothetical protein